MGLLDNNIVRQAAKEFNLTGAATTNNSYLNGGSGIFDVSKYSTLCFQVNSITSEVVFYVYGGITNNYFVLPTFNSQGEVVTAITTAGTYYADVSKVKKAGFYVKTGVENGTLNIDVLLKTIPFNCNLKPVQLITKVNKATTASATHIGFAITDGDSATKLKQFKFIVVTARYKNGTSSSIRTSMSLYIYGQMSNGFGVQPKLYESTTNSAFISTDWVPIRFTTTVIKLEFSAAAVEGDNVDFEIYGIR